MALRTLDYLCKDAMNTGVSFGNINLFAVLPLLPDIGQFLEKLQFLGMNIDTIIGIEYSSKKEVVNNLRNRKLEVTVPSYEQLKEEIAERLSNALTRCKHEKKKLIIVENGGYAVPIFHNQFENLHHLCIGAVEETKRGLWNDENDLINPLFPILQIADSSLKELESPQIGESIVHVLESAIRSLGLTVAGMKVCVIGIGWIGSAVARALEYRGASVSCFDIDWVKMVRAKLRGYHTGDKIDLLKNSDIVIGTTGQTSIKSEDLDILSDGAVLASGSSRNSEIDMKHLNGMSISHAKVNRYLTKYVTTAGKELYVVGEGFPLSFMVANSASDEVMDLVISSLFICVKRLATEKLDPKVYEFQPQDEQAIARLWYQLYEKNVIRTPNEPREHILRKSTAE